MQKIELLSPQMQIFPRQRPEAGRRVDSRAGRPRVDVVVLACLAARREGRGAPPMSRAQELDGSSAAAGRVCESSLWGPRPARSATGAAAGELHHRRGPRSPPTAARSHSLPRVCVLDLGRRARLAAPRPAFFLSSGAAARSHGDRLRGTAGGAESWMDVGPAARRVWRPGAVVASLVACLSPSPGRWSLFVWLVADDWC
jgi:hypothetical protein